MDVKFLGTGGAFDYKYGNSALWINLNGSRILVDCGHTVYPILRDNGMLEELDYILVTHLHDDHVGSLCTTILHHTFASPEPRKARIIVPNSSFEATLKAFLTLGLNDPEAYVEFIPIDEVPGLEAIDTFGLHVPDAPSFGYIFEDDHEIVAFSGDLADADVVFYHLAYYKGKGKPIRVFHEMTFEKTTTVHVYYQDLIPYMKDYDIFAYHLDPSQVPADNIIPLVYHQASLMI